MDESQRLEQALKNIPNGAILSFLARPSPSRKSILVALKIQNILGEKGQVSGHHRYMSFLVDQKLWRKLLEALVTLTSPEEDVQ